MGPDHAINTRGFAFIFGSDTSGAAFECRVVGFAWRSCQSGEFFVFPAELVDGDHEFEVRAFAAGVYEQQPKSAAFALDTERPTTAITGGPATGATSTTATPTFEFSSIDGGVTYECGIDGGGFQSCSSPFTTSPLFDGSHSFAVRATDAAGNRSTARTSAFEVDTGSASDHDTVPPDTELIEGPANGSAVATQTPSFVARSTEPATFECRYDNAAFVQCGIRFTTPVLDEGVHTVAVRGIDTAGNADPSPASRTFTVDTVQPEPPAFTTTMPEIVGSSDALINFAGEPDATFECVLDDHDWAACSSGQLLSSLSEGLHRFRVRQIDRAQNRSEVATKSWTVDTLRPQQPTALHVSFPNELASRVTWGAAADTPVDSTGNTGSGIAGYRVRYCMSYGPDHLCVSHDDPHFTQNRWSNWVELGANEHESDVVTPGQVGPGADYAGFEVAAVDRAGNWSTLQQYCWHQGCEYSPGSRVGAWIDWASPDNVDAFGPFRDLDGKYIDGKQSYPITVRAHDDYSGVRRVKVATWDPENSTGAARSAIASLSAFDTRSANDPTLTGSMAPRRPSAAWPSDGSSTNWPFDRDQGGESWYSSDANCIPKSDPQYPDDVLCPHQYSATLSFDTNGLPEGVHWFEPAAIDGAGIFGDDWNAHWHVIVDRTGPAAATDLEEVEYETSGRTRIAWEAGQDPDIAPEIEGSQTDSSLFRYRVNGGIWSDVRASVDEDIVYDSLNIGDVVEMEIRTVDAVGNVGPSYFDSVVIADINDPSDEERGAETGSITVNASLIVQGSDQRIVVPLPDETISISTASGTFVEAVTKQDGVANVPGVPVGTNEVAIVDSTTGEQLSVEKPVVVTKNDNSVVSLNVISAASGGPVKNKAWWCADPHHTNYCPYFYADQDKAVRYTKRIFAAHDHPDADGYRGNSFQHSYWVALMMNSIKHTPVFPPENIAYAIAFANLDELITLNESPEVKKRQHSRMDLHNNASGFEAFFEEANLHSDSFYCKKLRRKARSAKFVKFYADSDVTVNEPSTSRLMYIKKGVKVRPYDDDYGDGRGPCGERR